jgi:hypothetical protein
VYDLLDELAADGFIEINTTVKPFSRAYIAEQLKSVVGNESLNKRQKEEVLFFIQEFAPEYRQLPEARFHVWKNDHSKAAILPPAFHYADSNFTALITPLLGLPIVGDQNSLIHLVIAPVCCPENTAKYGKQNKPSHRR